MNKTEQLLTDARLHNTHWGRRIINADKLGGFSVYDIDDSSSWVTCACGKTTADIPRGRVNVLNPHVVNTRSPKDQDLFDLGNMFAEHVLFGSTYDAAQTLIKIEKRAQIVAREHHE